MAHRAEIFSEWLRRQGYRVIQTPSTYWYEAMPRVYQAFPYHWQIHPTQAEVRGLLKQNRAIALRCSNPLSTGRGAISYHVVYDKAAYELDALDRRTRQNIRSGLKHCTVERVPLQRLAEEGWELEADTVRRQRRQFSMNQAAWRRKYLSAQGLKGFEAWGALVDGKLAASILLFHA